MTLHGIDVSSYQTGIDLTRVPGDVVIVKATEGRGYRNPAMAAQVASAMAAGKRLGLYHFVSAGNTPAEERQGETLEMRVAQEEPESAGPDETPWNPDDEPREVGSVRAGRLVDANHGEAGADTTSEAVAFAVGIDGGAASAEEAAMHIIESQDDDDIV